MLKLQIELSGLDIFALSEIWLSKAVPYKVVGVLSFNVCRLGRAWNSGTSVVLKKGGGLALYIRKNIQFSDTKYGAFNCQANNYNQCI